MFFPYFQYAIMFFPYFQYVLYMDGRGSYEFNPIDESTTEFGS